MAIQSRKARSLQEVEKAEQVAEAAQITPGSASPYSMKKAALKSRFFHGAATGMVLADLQHYLNR